MSLFLTKRGYYEGFCGALLRKGVRPEHVQVLVKQAQVPWGMLGAGAGGLALGGLGGYALGSMGGGEGAPPEAALPEPSAAPEVGMGAGGLGPEMGAPAGGGMQLTPQEEMYLLQSLMQQQAAPQYDPYFPYSVY